MAVPPFAPRLGRGEPVPARCDRCGRVAPHMLLWGELTCEPCRDTLATPLAPPAAETARPPAADLDLLPF